MRCVGTFEASNGRRSTVAWYLHRVKIGKQDPGLFEVPRGYAKLPPEAAASCLGCDSAGQSLVKADPPLVGLGTAQPIVYVGDMTY